MINSNSKHIKKHLFTQRTLDNFDQNLTINKDARIGMYQPAAFAY